MNDNRTATMLQRVPVILAVTAASYGLQVPVQALRLAASPQPAAIQRFTHEGTTRPALPRLATLPIYRT